MRPPDLKSAAVLGARRPHGHKMRYMAGCRCAKCKRGNRDYERKMQQDRLRFGPNDLVLLDLAREHIMRLRAQFGIGHKTIGPFCGVGKTIVGEIIWPGKSGRKFIRRRTQNKILAYEPTLDTMSQIAKVPAADTVAKLRQLIAWGYPKLLVSRDALKNAGALQVHALEGKVGTVEVKTARRIRDFFEMVEALRAEWRQKRGEIPRGFYVYWKGGTLGCTIRAMELRPFGRGYDYHYRYTSEMKQAIRVNNQLKKLRRKLAHGKKHIERLTGSSVRATGKAA